MKFPRNAKIFRGQLEMAPFAGVFFLLIIFLVLQSSLVFTPGVQVELPAASDLAGVQGAAVSVVVDSQGNYYFGNQQLSASELSEALEEALDKTSTPLTLIIQADQQVRYGALIDLILLAREVGIGQIVNATRPR